MRERGFTFTELLVVIAIIIFLLAITIPVSRTAMNRAKVKVAMADIAKLENAIELYRDKYGDYPSSLIVLYTLGYVRFSKNQIDGSDIIDPWRKPYLYDPTPVNNTAFVDLASSGPDRLPGVWQNDNNLQGTPDDSTDSFLSGGSTDGFADVLDNINNWSTKY